MWLVVLGILVVLVVVGLLVWFIEDPVRDFTTNYAVTSAEASDPLLRPLVVNRSADEVISLVQRAASMLPRWRFAGEVVEGDTTSLAFVRTTMLLRFKDDVVVHVERTPQGCVVTGESRSRVGKGDLGQNPRNLRELFDSLRTLLRMSAPVA